MYGNAELKKIFKPFVELNEELISEMKIYTSEVKAWNKGADLTSLETDEEIYIAHFLDSFTLLPYIRQGAKLLDVGTGGGFPGCALKLAKKDIRPWLMDASNKKTVFLDHMKNLLQLEGVEVVWGRAEEFAKKQGFREEFDVVTARAVAEMVTLAELCIPFVKLGGIFLAQKGKNKKEVEQATGAIELLGGKIKTIKKLKLPGDTSERQIVIIEKLKPTPEKYPRRAGVPQKNPLKVK
jgi:16S rRNA (guanine527-N7)-methyltransferase